MTIIKNRIYFFLTRSVFQQANEDQTSDSFKFLFKSVLIKVMHGKKIEPHIVSYLQDDVQNIKTEFQNFKSFMVIGDHMFFAEDKPGITGALNERILSYATDMDGEIFEEDKVKIVCANYETEKNFNKLITEHNFPVEEINISKGLKILEDIEQELQKGNGYIEEKEDVPCPKGELGVTSTSEEAKED